MHTAKLNDALHFTVLYCTVRTTCENRELSLFQLTVSMCDQFKNIATNELQVWK
jgi:hypothetical protein